MSGHSASVEKVQQDNSDPQTQRGLLGNDVELEQETKVNKQGDTPDEAGKADEQHRTDNAVDENDVEVEVEHESHSWPYIAQLRAGHTLLNGQKKFGFKTRNCDFCRTLNVDTIEDVLHFICKCERYSSQRKIMRENIIEIDQKYEKLFGCADTALLFNLLFPYQDELMDINVNRNVLENNKFLNLRMEILYEICSYVLDTKRIEIEE